MSIPSAIFTIVSANYIAFAATLMQSVRRFHPDVPRFIILSDAAHSFDDLDLAAEIVACDDLGIELIGNMKLWYSVIEFNTAVKPFTFRHLFNARGFEQAIYLDPDIQLYSPLHEVFRGLEDHSLVLTPHMMKPLQDGKHPSDLSIMKSGVYNLGFAAIKNDQDGRGLVDWWCDRLFAHCRVDVAANIFTDQRWMDLSPVFVERPFILRHPGYNVAYWNLVHRTVEQGPDGTWRSNGLPLAFFHFSGIKPEDPTLFSKHQDRFTIETLGPVAQLCDEYRAKVLANGWLTHNKIPYAYGTFGDGRKILDAMRRWVLDAIDRELLDQHQRLRIDSAFFDQADDQIFPGGSQLTRFCAQFWRDRSDLRSAFNLQQQTGFDGYVAWFCGGSAEREGIPDSLVQAARALRDGLGQQRYLPPEPTRPPWPPVATDAWVGPASLVADWIRGEVAFDLGRVNLRMQRQFALLWERRIDLQQYFPLSTSGELEQFQVWALTDGMLEGSVRADLFSARFVAWLDAPSSISRLYPEIAITNGMALTRGSRHLRSGMSTWTQFPLEANSRIEHAFWYAYIAPKAFGWPAAMTATVTDALDRPSDVSLCDYSFSHGMVSIHAMREDVRALFDLGNEVGKWNYLCWLVIQGANEYGLDPVELCPGVVAFLASPSPKYPLLSRLAMMAYDRRADLQAAFNLNARSDLAGFLNWVRGEMTPWLHDQGLDSLLPERKGAVTSLSPPVFHAMAALSGDWDAFSGIGEDLRSSAAALDACGFSDYVIVNMNAGTILRSDGTPLPPGTPVEVGTNVLHRNADTAASDWLTIQSMSVSARRMVGHWHWELERLPSRWLHAYSFFDEIWASSRFAAEAFAADGLRPVRMLNGAVTVPNGVKPLRRSRFGLHADATVFLFMFDWASYATRKNPHAVIRAFVLAFPLGTERVQLLIKTQNAALRPELWADLSAQIRDERILLKNESMARDELAGLILATDAFVSLHRSEGYGRVPAEAMLLGVPVILTGYSGTADFADDDTACVVDYTLVPVEQTDYPGVEHQRWAEADIADAARHMRWIHEQPDQAHMLALRGQQRIGDLLSPAKVGSAMIAMLLDGEEGLARSPQSGE